MGIFNNKKYRIFTVIILLILFIITGISVTETANAVLNQNDVKIKSKAAIVMDYKSGAILYEKNAHKKIYPASTTKILTAIVALENSKMDDVLTVSENALKGQENNGTHIGLKKGEKITMKDALYGMMLESANDASIAIAEGISGSEEEFAKLLNAKVKELGLKNSHFVTPNGLFSKDHYTTPYDMAKIIQYAYNNKEFRDLYGAVKYTLAKTNKREKPQDIYTTHRMTPGKSKAYKYTVGGKTGFLDESKCNLSTVAKKDDLTLISYVATNNSPFDIADDTTKLFEKCFKTYKTASIKKNDTIEDIIKDSTFNIKNSELAKNSIDITIPNDANINDITFSIIDKEKSRPISKDDITGTLVAQYNNDNVGYVDLKASKDITSFNFIISMIIKILLIVVMIAIVIILILRIYFTRKKRKGFNSRVNRKYRKYKKYR